MKPRSFGLLTALLRTLVAAGVHLVATDAVLAQAERDHLPGGCRRWRGEGAA